MTTPSDENVQYNITLEAQKALIVLAELTNKTRSFADQMNYAKNVVREFAKDSGMSFAAAKNTLAGLDKELSGTAASSVAFGSKGQEAWNKVGEASEKASNKMSFSMRAVNVAIGMLIHQGINLLINAFQAMFTMAIKGLRELETATYNLVNAERTLSEQGVEITPQGLEESIKNLQKLDPLLSKIQATEAVSRISSLVAPNVGLNAKEIDQLTQSIAILAVKNRGLGKSFEEVESQVSNAFLSGKVSVGINQLGVKITDQIVKDEALRMGLVKTADEFDNLTGKMASNIKARAMLSVITQATSKEVAHLPEFLKTADAKFGIFQARMQDFFTSLGKVAAPLIQRVLDVLIEGFTKASDWVDKNRESLLLFADVAGKVLVIVLKVTGVLIKFGIAGVQAINGMITGLQKLADKIPFLKKIADLLGVKGIGDAQDTPTGTPETEASAGASSRYGEAVAEAEEKVTEIMQEARDKRLDMEKDYQDKMSDLARDYSRKTQDISRDSARKRADAQDGYSDKIRDINVDADKKIAEAQQESHQKAIDAEKKYQDELKNLREKYLLDLEDALHERDARQILRLMRQYNIDKNKAKENSVSEREQAKAEAAQKIVDLEQERKDKIALAKKELADKLEEIKRAELRERQDAATAHRRALADARTAYNRQLEEQRIFLQRKLRDLAAALAEEYNLTAAQAARLAQVINTQAGATSSTGTRVGSGGTTTTVAASTLGSVGNASSPSSINAGTYRPGLAEGGTFLATRPTSINVAENRPEMITATPLGKPGRDIGKLFSDGGIGGGNGGQITIDLLLSPDLEARVVSKSMDGVANVITRVNRSKV